jgi:hypothetical protein
LLAGKTNDDSLLLSCRASWFIRTHQPVMAAADFFTAEVMTQAGLFTYYVCSFKHLGSRRIHIAGERWCDGC